MTAASRGCDLRMVHGRTPRISLECQAVTCDEVAWGSVQGILLKVNHSRSVQGVTNLNLTEQLLESSPSILLSTRAMDGIHSRNLPASASYL